MFDMNKIKAVCFDFDLTLCCWREHSKTLCPGKRSECAKKGINYYDTLGTDGKPWYTKYDAMQLFIDNFCKSKHCFLLSGCEEYAQWMKVDWVERNYRVNVENRCVVKVISKVPMLQSIATELSCKPEEILMVDDNLEEVCFPAQKAGFSTALPADVTQYLFNAGVLK